MARKEHPKCWQCKHRWMVDVDYSGEYGHWILHGCTRPTRRKFQGTSVFGCVDFTEDSGAIKNGYF